MLAPSPSPNNPCIRHLLALPPLTPAVLGTYWDDSNWKSVSWEDNYSAITAKCNNFAKTKLVLRQCCRGCEAYYTQSKMPDGGMVSGTFHRPIHFILPPE